MNLQRLAMPVPVRPDEGDIARVTAEAFQQHCLRLGRWLPFARIVRGLNPLPDGGEEVPLHIFVDVRLEDLDVTVEILTGFFSPACPEAKRAAGTTFIDVRSAPVVVVQVRPVGSALDASARLGNARWPDGGLLAGNERPGVKANAHRRISLDEPQCEMDPSFRQAGAGG